MSPRARNATLVALAALVALSCCIRPDVTPGQDAALFLAGMRQFQAQGLRAPCAMEPLYPLFLALLAQTGIAVERCAPLVQNILFGAALYLFLRSLCGRKLGRLQALQLSLAITAIPTFFIVMNGALYTESLTATLTLLLLSSFVRLARGLGGAPSPCPLPQEKRENKSATAAWLVVGFAASCALGLLRGSCIYIHYLFGLLGLAWLLLAEMHRKGAPSPNPLPQGERKKRAALHIACCLWFVLAAAGSKCGTAIWMKVQQKDAPVTAQLYERAGTILYGRTEYAKRFDFRTQSFPYLLNALSESACRRVYGADAAQYGFLAENELGYQKRLREGTPDEELFRAGLRNLLAQPLRQGFFAGFELSRFILHHGTVGFAVLDVPVAGGIIHSLPMSVALKLFNLALLAALPFYVFKYFRKDSALRQAWQSLPPQTRAGTACYLLYVAAYLAVYGFATTVVRMAYPIAPFLVILNWQLARPLPKRTAN